MGLTAPGARVAALYDVHGNLPALEAVLAEVEAERPDLIVFGGDLVWGAWPRECLERALALAPRARFLRGNTDRAVLESEATSFPWTRARLTGEQRERIAAWPATVRLELAGLGPTLFCHATPRSDSEIVTPASPESRWAEALAGVDEHVVVCGHTHLSYDEEHAGHRVVNPGSVGHPTVRAAAWWAMLGPDVELRATGYDAAAAAAAVQASGFPRGEGADELLQPPSREHHLAELERRA